MKNVKATVDSIIGTSKPPKVISGDDIKNAIEEIMDEKVPTPTIKGITYEDEECHLLLEKDSGVISAPLTKLGLELATAFEQKLTSTALCFIADASSGLGTKILGEVVSNCSGLVS